MKFLLDVLQVAIVLRLVWVGAKWLLFRKHRKSHRRSVVGKVWALLVSNPIHHALDQRLAKQKEAYQSKTEQTSSEGNVVPLKRSTT